MASMDNDIVRRGYMNVIRNPSGGMVREAVDTYIGTDGRVAYIRGLGWVNGFQSHTATHSLSTT